MPLMTEAERDLARAISRLTYSNPFLPERIEAERDALGPAFVATDPIWHARIPPEEDSPNVGPINERVEFLADTLRERMRAGSGPTRDEPQLYEDLVLYLLYNRHVAELHRLVVDGKAAGRATFYTRFLKDVEQYSGLAKRPSPAREDAARLFALFFQIRRAFHFTFRNILGGSLPAARLRAAVWQAIFTRDMRRYRRALAERMHDVTTLITGPSGTGKELVAQAIGLARYLPFDPERQVFAEDFTGSFYALNLSALPPTLIESELFGHRRGAFTGAVQDRAGWLEVCPPLGTVFLDEIAEVDVAIQVKLLRVLQTRTFQRVGDSRERSFRGKIIAATNRDLAKEMQAGHFREDLYYRLCSDVIETPPLEAQLRDSPDELGHLLRFIAARVAGEAEAEALAEEAERWITEHLGRDYPWPGNVRELEQCVRNVMIRGEYRPQRRAPASPRDELTAAVLAGALTADELLRRYCTLVFAQTGNYVETARRLGLDRRTVKDKIESALLKRLRAAGSEREP